MAQKEIGVSPFLLPTAHLMPTPRKSAPFGLDVTRGRSQPSRQPAVHVKIIHKIAELELELLNIVRDHYGLELPTVTPMYIPVQGAGGNAHKSETCRPPSGLDNNCEGPGQPIGVSHRSAPPRLCVGSSLSDSLTRFKECVLRHLRDAELPIEITSFFEKQGQALLSGDSVELFSTEAYGRSQLGIKATTDLMPILTIPGLDMLLVELDHVACEEDLVNLSFNTTSIAEFQGRWFLGLWAGRFINHACLPNAAFTYDKRPRQHMLRPGIYVQSCSIGSNFVGRGNEVTVDYGLDYFGPGNAECRCETREHYPDTSAPWASLELLANVSTDSASPIKDKGRREFPYHCVNGSGTTPSNLVTELSSGTREQTKYNDGTLSPLSQHIPINDHYTRTPFTTISSVPQASRWQKRSSQYKDDHVQQKKGRRQRNRIAIGLLTIPLPIELRCTGIRPLNEEIRRLEWWERRGSLTENQQTHLGIYQEIQREWQKLLKA